MGKLLREFKLDELQMTALECRLKPGAAVNE